MSSNQNTDPTVIAITWFVIGVSVVIFLMAASA